MLEILAPTVLAMAFVAICLSSISLAIHWRDHRAPSPASLTAEIQALRIAQADVVDRLEHWTRRDRVRRLRDRNSNEGGKAPGDSGVDELVGDSGGSGLGEVGGLGNGGVRSASELYGGNQEKVALRKIARAKGLIR